MGVVGGDGGRGWDEWWVGWDGVCGWTMVVVVKWKGLRVSGGGRVTDSTLCSSTLHILHHIPLFSVHPNTIHHILMYPHLSVFLYVLVNSIHSFIQILFYPIHYFLHFQILLSCPS